MNQEYIISIYPNGSVYIYMHVGDNILKRIHAHEVREDIHYESRMITIKNTIIGILYL